MSKTSEKKYGACQNQECMNYGISDIIPDDGNCPICHLPMKPEEESVSDDIFDSSDIDETGIGDASTRTGHEKRGFKFIGIILAALLLLGGIGIGVYMLVNILSGDSKPTAIKLEKSKITMKVGETIVLNPKVEPEGAKATFTFKVKKDSKDLIRVGNGGEVTALKSGNTVILIKCEENSDIRATCRITIEENNGGETHVQKITINEPSITMTTGEKKDITVSVEPKNFNEQILKTSSDDNIAVLMEGDKIIAKNAGTAIITFRGEKSGVSASVNVTVKDKPATTDGGGSHGGGKPTPSPGYGTAKLSYGTYKGELKNGQPHGHGTVTFTTTRRIVSSQDYIAHPGDRYEGEWRNGVITGGLGYWYHDGNTTGIRP